MTFIESAKKKKEEITHLNCRYSTPLHKSITQFNTKIETADLRKSLKAEYKPFNTVDNFYLKKDASYKVIKHSPSLNKDFLIKKKKLSIKNAFPKLSRKFDKTLFNRVYLDFDSIDNI